MIMTNRTVFTYGGKNPFEAAITEHMIQVDQNDQGSKLFTVTYGLQVKRGLTYAKACTEIGAAILHYLSCEGVVDNEVA